MAFPCFSDALENYTWSDNYRSGTWHVASDRPERYLEWTRTFHSLSQVDGKITGTTARAHMEQSRLQEATLAK
jgi:hypothetical protein